MSCNAYPHRADHLEADLPVQVATRWCSPAVAARSMLMVKPCHRGKQILSIPCSKAERTILRNKSCSKVARSMPLTSHFSRAAHTPLAMVSRCLFNRYPQIKIVCMPPVTLNQRWPTRPPVETVAGHLCPMTHAVLPVECQHEYKTCSPPRRVLRVPPFGRTMSNCGSYS